MKTKVLNVGESMTLKKGFIMKQELIYTGMPNDRCYSVAYCWSSGNNSAAYSLFFPVTRSRIEIAKKHFSVIQVSPERMEIQPVEMV
jgi:hypothetical protein